MEAEEVVEEEAGVEVVVVEEEEVAFQEVRYKVF